MPRDGSGVMTIVNSFTAGNPIVDTSTNTNNDDIAAEITNSIAANGITTITNPIRFANGSAAAPSITFAGDSGTNTGFYRVAEDEIGVTCGGTLVFTFKTGGGNLFSPPGSITAFAGILNIPAGWLLCNGQTIGAVDSGADLELGAVATQEGYFLLYDKLWLNFGQTEIPVTGGRGASPQADWDAGKPIQLPDLRGRGLFGHDEMGVTAAGRLTNQAKTGFDGTVAGSTGGGELNTLTAAEIPAHTHGLNTSGNATIANNGSHSHDVYNQTSQGVTSGPLTLPGVGTNNNGFNGDTNATGSHSHSLSGTTEEIGGGEVHNNMPPGFVVGWIIAF